MPRSGLPLVLAATFIVASLTSLEANDRLFEISNRSTPQFQLFVGTKLEVHLDEESAVLESFGRDEFLARTSPGLHPLPMQDPDQIRVRFQTRLPDLTDAQSEGVVTKASPVGRLGSTIIVTRIRIPSARWKHSATRHPVARPIVHGPLSASTFHRDRGPHRRSRRI